MSQSIPSRAGRIPFYAFFMRHGLRCLFRNIIHRIREQERQGNFFSLRSYGDAAMEGLHEGRSILLSFATPPQFGFHIAFSVASAASVVLHSGFRNYGNGSIITRREMRLGSTPPCLIFRFLHCLNSIFPIGEVIIRYIAGDNAMDRK